MGRPARSVTGARAALGAVAAVVLGLLLAFWTQGDTPSDEARDPSTAQSSSTGAPPDAGTPTDPVSGLPVVRLADLPPEAREAVDRIDRGGPFPYDEDDGVFENREELLPDRPLGHYREYTVGGRPGDRGPLRIVAGEDDELYWTEDHYRSFSRIER